MNEIITEYFTILLNQFKFDINVFSQPWMYYWLLVPAICYLMFFYLKWSVLLAPIWIPISAIFGGIRAILRGCGKR